MPTTPAPPDVTISIGQPGFDKDPQGGLWIFEVLVDFVFIADVCLNFRTTEVDSVTKETITDAKDISIRQASGPAIGFFYGCFRTVGDFLAK